MNAKQKREVHRKGLTIHHRKPKSKGGSDEPIGSMSNLSVLTLAKHQAWHTLVGDRDAENICKLLNNVYLDPEYEFVCLKRYEAEKKKLGYFW